MSRKGLFFFGSPKRYGDKCVGGNNQCNFLNFQKILKVYQYFNLQLIAIEIIAIATI